MKRVFTDPRFPGFEVHNDGDNVFTVYEITNGSMYQIDSFRTYSDHPNRLIHDQVASKRAKDYFDRRAEGQAPGEGEMPEIEDTAVPIHHSAARTGDGLSQSRDLDSVLGDNILSADDVLAAYDRAKVMPEGEQREKAMAQVQMMAAQMESSASELVRSLLA